MATPTHFEPPEPWFTPIHRAIRAIGEFAGHALVLVAILAIIKDIEKVTIYLGSADKIYHFHRIAIAQAQVFNAADLALLVCILTIGIRATIKKYLENPTKSDKEETGVGAWKK